MRQSPDLSTVARTLGISLRPWPGHSPLSLIIRGVVSTAIGVLILTVVLRAMSELESLSDVPNAGPLGAMVVAGLVVVILVGVVRTVIGVIDLVSRRTVTGTVISLQERAMGDFLPRLVQRRLFEREHSGLDQRRSRTEVVVATDAGMQQWTIRDARTANQMIVGEEVGFTVTAIAGHLCGVRRL